MLNILACALHFGTFENNWALITVVVLYFCVPIPNIICGMCHHEDTLGDSNRAFTDAGFFITSVLFASFLGFPLVFYHAKSIHIANMFMSLAGGVVVALSAVAYYHLLKDEDEDDII